MILTWTQTRAVENSIIDFLESQITTDSLKLLDESGSQVTPNVYRGKKLIDNWNLPLIQVYFDDKLQPRLEIGSNLRMKSYLVIIEIRTLLPGQEVDLANWVEETLNNGCSYYTYAPSVDPENPTKTFAGHVNIDFQSSNPVNLGDNLDKFDKYRYRIVLKVWVNKKT